MSHFCPIAQSALEAHTTHALLEHTCPVGLVAQSALLRQPGGVMSTGAGVGVLLQAVRRRRERPAKEESNREHNGMVTSW